MNYQRLKCQNEWNECKHLSPAETSKQATVTGRERERPGEKCIARNEMKFDSIEFTFHFMHANILTLTLKNNNNNENQNCLGT